MALVSIDKIKVPERARKKFSNIDALAESIRENGLINPPTVTPDMELIAGERRLRACRQLGYEQIEVRVMPVSDAVHHLRLERDENDKREPFTFSEAVELGRRIEEIERGAARERMEAGTATDPRENFRKGRATDKVAEQVGFGSGKQYEKAKFVADHADEELIKQLDEKQISVHAAYQKLRSELIAAKQRADEAQKQAEQASKAQQQAEWQNKQLSKRLEKAEAERKRQEAEAIKRNPEMAKSLEDRADRQEQYKFEVEEARKFDKVLSQLFLVTGSVNTEMLHCWMKHCIGEKQSQIEAARLQVNLTFDKLKPIQDMLNQINRPVGVK